MPDFVGSGLEHFSLVGLFFDVDEEIAQVAVDTARIAILVRRGRTFLRCHVEKRGPRRRRGHGRGQKRKKSYGAQGQNRGARGTYGEPAATPPCPYRYTTSARGQGNQTLLWGARVPCNSTPPHATNRGSRGSIVRNKGPAPRTQATPWPHWRTVASVLRCACANKRNGCGEPSGTAAERGAAEHVRRSCRGRGQGGARRALRR